MKEKKKKDTLPVVVTEARMQILATLSVNGLSVHAIAKQLSLTRTRIKKMMATPEFASAVKDVTDEIVKAGRTQFILELAKATPEAIHLYKRLIEAGNPKALDIYLKTIGIEREPANAQAQNITVVLPNLEQPVLEVQSE